MAWSDLYRELRKPWSQLLPRWDGTHALRAPGELGQNRQGFTVVTLQVNPVFLRRLQERLSMSEGLRSTSISVTGDDLTISVGSGRLLATPGAVDLTIRFISTSGRTGGLVGNVG